MSVISFSVPTDLQIAGNLTVNSLGGLLKGTAGLVSVATAGVDYATPAQVTSTGAQLGSSIASLSGFTTNMSGQLQLLITGAANDVNSINGATGDITLTSAPANADYIRISNSGTTIYVSGLSTPTLSGVTLAGGAALSGAQGAIWITPSSSAVNGGLVLATHTTSGGGLGLGPDNSIWRTAANQVTYNGTLNLTGLKLPGGGTITGDGGNVYLGGALIGTSTATFATSVSTPSVFANGTNIQLLGAASDIRLSNGRQFDLTFDALTLKWRDNSSAQDMWSYTAGTGHTFQVGGVAALALRTSGAYFSSGIFFSDTGNYTLSGVASIAQLLAASGWLTNSATSNVVYTTGTQTINGAKSFAGSTLVLSGGQFGLGGTPSINTTFHMTPVASTSAVGGFAASFEVQPTIVAAANLDTLRVFDIDATLTKGSSTGLVFQGLHIGNPTSNGAGSLVNQYQIYLETPTRATNNYGVYSVGGVNYFGGNVGVGTITPAALFHVSGGNAIFNGPVAVLTSDGGVPMTITSTSTVMRKDILRLGRTGHSAANGFESLLSFYDSDNATYTAAVAGIRNNAGNDFGGSLAFYTTSGVTTSATGVGTLIERARISEQGFFGIGTSAPLTPLHVTGSTLLAVNGGSVGIGTSSVGAAGTLTMASGIILSQSNVTGGGVMFFDTPLYRVATNTLTLGTSSAVGQLNLRYVQGTNGTGPYIDFGNSSPLQIFGGALATNLCATFNSNQTTTLASGLILGVSTVTGGGIAFGTSANIWTSATNQLAFSTSGTTAFSLSPLQDALGARNISAASGLFFADTGNYTRSGAMSVAQGVGLSGVLRFPPVVYTTTANTTTTLTTASAYLQIFSGAANQNCQFPAANAQGAGQSVNYLIANKSAGTVTLLAAAGDNIETVASYPIYPGTRTFVNSDGINSWILA